ncbi:LysR family transcriptional regulator [Cytobacillus oceanisediminis]|uniref:LysR family transcriptional regulator n=1 Tax=Niallia alba TaxID=2729105 RepID=A0A7Y0K9D3_9BACI|nr:MULTISPECIES: LysR family transcriptional regulator [Bacillaceae]MBQ6448752.1 LysR family transcriptional regulator [Bacillus sp. (in: firmicutes)]MBZ9537046.1 LysR family transcriptional regulator [Cytobacillus oceanisediminis]NMO78100.1 LysR family transcriptional regulator [Niallia alba]UTI41387.1 LysR family transcriptional regulator [Niallia sp. RD1]
MEIRQLHYFVEVVKQKNMTKASDKLHISQPALSKAIKSLESEIGLTLIHRSNKTHELTDAGSVVFEYAQKIIAQVEEMSFTLHDMTNLTRGNINIGLPPIIGSLFFPKIIAAFHKAYPNIQINIREYGAAKVVKSVEEGEFEMGVAVLPLTDDSFHIFPLVKEALKLIVPESHRFANRKKVHMKELKAEEFIFYSEEFALYEIMRRKFIQEGFEPNIIFKSSQWDFMVEIVAANLGISILPESICNRANNNQVRFIDLEPVTNWELVIITKKDRYLSVASRRFIDFVLNNE